MNDMSSASLLVVRCLSIQALNFNRNRPCKEAIFTVNLSSMLTFIASESTSSKPFTDMAIVSSGGQ